MPSRGFVIFDVFHTLVTSRPGYEQTFLAGLVEAGMDASTDMLATLHAASEGLDHSEWSGSRHAAIAFAPAR